MIKSSTYLLGSLAWTSPDNYTPQRVAKPAISSPNQFFATLIETASTKYEDAPISTRIWLFAAEDFSGWAMVSTHKFLTTLSMQLSLLTRLWMPWDHKPRRWTIFQASSSPTLLLAVLAVASAAWSRRTSPVNFRSSRTYHIYCSPLRASRVKRCRLSPTTLHYVTTI